MISGDTVVVLADVESGAMNQDTGDRIKVVSSAKVLVLTVDLVGIQTLQYGQSLGNEFSYSLKISRMLYNNEKYCYFDSKLYEVKGIGKAKYPTDMLLLVCELDDDDVKTAITTWCSPSSSGQTTNNSSETNENEEDDEETSEEARDE